ncbi:MAG: transketolase [Sphaerochaetaceae bacterium]|nr:transketolase [Sphaerochaetaceae bacterium]
MDQAHAQKLKDIARDVRVLALSSMGYLGVGHVGGAMSVVDILTYLYYSEMHIDPNNPRDEQRDRLVLSKGHAGPALYAVLARKGFFPIEWLDTLNVGGTHLPSHCDRNQTPGIDMTTGSLGQGLSAAVGIALAMRMDGRKRYTFAIIGDGESQEGQNWEAAMCASQYGLDNLIAFTDYNKMQIDGTISDVMELEDLSARWAAFGWHVQKIDGHDFEAIEEAIEKAKQASGKPSMIILDTIKGKGCSFAEGKISSHNMPISQEQLDEALAALTEVK